MANNPFWSDAAVTAAMDARLALLGGGTVEIYDGTQPTDANTALGSQTLLVTLTLSATAFAASAASGAAGSRVVSAAANAITAGVAVATGTATWYRAKDSSGNGVHDGTVGTAGTDMVLNSAAIASGDGVSVTSWTVSQTE